MQRATWAAVLLLMGVMPTAHGDERRAWIYSEQGSERAYVEVAPGQWLGTHPTKPPATMNELERDDAQVIIQNTSSKLIIRLTDGRAYWRRPTDSDWTTYVKGTWGTLPKSIAATLPAPENRAGPKPADEYRAKAVYFVPADRRPTNNWEQKIQVVLYFVESMYRNDLQLKRLETEGLRFQRQEDKPRVYLIQGKHPASYYNNAPAYDADKQFELLAPEVAAVIGRRSESLGIVFAETYDETPSDRLWNGVIARGGYYSANGGLGVFSAHLLKDEFCATNVQQQPAKFFDTTPVPGRRALGHRMNSPRCEFVEDGFGAVIHEMGHALGLPHDMRNQELFIMSNGFRNIRRNLSRNTPRNELVTFSDVNTHLLMASRYINAKLDMSDTAPPQAELQLLGVDRSGLRLGIKASDDRGLRAWAILDNVKGSVITGGGLQGTEWTQPLTVAAEADAGEFRLMLIVADEGGHQTRIRQEFGAANR